MVRQMIRVCPNPVPWNEVFGRLTEYARTHRCSPPSPPVPLILGGWWATNDFEKIRRWEETVAWAISNGCAHLVDISSDHFYCVDEPSSDTGELVFGEQYHEPKPKPQRHQIAKYLQTLITRWEEIVGSELARVSTPVALTGAKARRLIVRADGTVRPPWGSWHFLTRREEAKRRAFTRFRASINAAIAPHEVDHIDFTTHAGS